MYGTIFDPSTNGNKYFDVWTLGVWHSFCLSASNEENKLKLYFDKKLVLTDEQYSGIMSQAKENLKFNDERNKLNHEITDLNIWNVIKSDDFITIFATCQSAEKGNNLKWSATNFDQSLTDSIEENNVCVKREDKVMAFEGKLRFDETVRFCSKLGGKMAVAKNELKFKKLNSSIRILESCDEFYIGYSDRVHEGNRVDVNDILQLGSR